MFHVKSLFLDLVTSILARMGEKVTGKTLGRIAVEVGEKEDVRRLVEAGTVVFRGVALKNPGKH